jgi:hypothetical protein
MKISVAKTTEDNADVSEGIDEIQRHQVIGYIITIRECNPDVVAEVINSFDELETLVDILEKDEDSDDPDEHDPNVVKIEVSHLSDNNKADDAATRLVDWLNSQYDIVEQKLQAEEEE